MPSFHPIQSTVTDFIDDFKVKAKGTNLVNPLKT